jgi:hypothetical protein
MPTLAERLVTAIETLESLVANTTGTGDMVLKTGADIAPQSVSFYDGTNGIGISADSIYGYTAGDVVTWSLNPATGASTVVSLNGNAITTGAGTLTLNSYTLTVSGTASISGTNTGDQTSVAGNAGTATALATARTIFGQLFDGTANIGGGTINLGGNLTTGGLFATVGTFSSGGNFATGGTFSTGGSFTTVGDFTAGGAFTTSHAFTTTGGAVTLTLTGTTNVTLPTSGRVTTDERMMRMYRFAVGASAATISTSTSSWGSLITNGASAVARLHSYFTISTSASLASSRYSFWVEAGAGAVNPHAFAGHPFYGLNYAKGLEVSFPINAAQLSSTTAVLPSDGYLSGYFGQARNTHYEDIVQVGFGFLLKGDGTIQLQALATNGGSVVKSSFVASGLDLSVNASAVASLIRITSDVSGNLTLFVNGVSKCTLSGGPTGLTNVSTSNFTVFTFTMSNGAGTPTKATPITIGLPLFIL